jgi:hypothetical protein
VVLGLLVCVGLVVAGWVSDPAAATGWPHAVRLGASAWLLVHLGEVGVLSEVAASPSPAEPLTQVSGVLSLPPLLLVLLAAGPAWRAGERVAGRRGPVRALLLLLVLAGGYAGAAWLLAWAVDTPVVTPDPAACALGAGLLALGAALLGVLRRRADALLGRLPRHVEAQVRRVVPAAGVALAAWLLAGAVLLSAALLLHLATVGDVHASLAPGLGGGVVLLLLQLAFLPVAVVWAAAVLAGPGTWLAGSHVGPGGSSVVDVPAVPLLAALPSPGAFPLWAFLAPAAVVAAGALAAWHAHRDPSSRGATLGDRTGDAVAVGALAASGPCCWPGWRAARSGRGRPSARTRSCSPGQWARRCSPGRCSAGGRCTCSRAGRSVVRGASGRLAPGAVTRGRARTWQPPPAGPVSTRLLPRPPAPAAPSAGRPTAGPADVRLPSRAHRSSASCSEQGVVAPGPPRRG